MQQRVLVLIIKDPINDSKQKSLPFPIARDLEPPSDLFRNTIKRLRKYITHLKKDKKQKAIKSDGLFLTNNGQDEVLTSH